MTTGTNENAIRTGDFTLVRDGFGRLVLTGADGVAHEGVMPVRAFPISSPDTGLAIMSADGHELAWVDDRAALPADLAALIAEELSGREFMPEIRAIVSVSSYMTPSTWSVATDRGGVSFVLSGEEHIRRLAGGMLLIADSHGVHFLIRDPKALDRASRKILDRFL
ncbi:cyanophycin metabolism-associated DUF1854 family protein [Zeimonas arvi]|uniref:DUF1854 domain-containing protein n=1 Tax=Zeimonas arvi TaxID=2498847 RepID=A0A5C8P551_9BURK|nr:DUF1854 domain-containing protein [Zeimonas arvi]TXL68365.1 DUF1854 domain-containing protein [Zeimonas arvi]